MQRRKLERWLRQHQASYVRAGAKHDVWRGPNGQQATMPRHREVNTRTAHGICDQLGVTAPPWR